MATPFTSLNHFHIVIQHIVVIIISLKNICALKLTYLLNSHLLVSHLNCPEFNKHPLVLHLIDES